MLNRSPKSRDDAFVMQLQGYRLATAEIIYHMPDHPHLLQSFIWQQYDLAPSYPVLKRFLEFWQKNLDGAIHTVRVASVDLIKPAEIRALNGVLHLH
jgi:uncharacterized protein Usg